MLASDRELPVSGGPEKRAYVRDIFTAIAPTYDRLNRIISLRFDQRWRRYAVATAGVGAATGRNLSRPVRRHARFRGDAGPAARVPRAGRRRRLRRADAAAGPRQGGPGGAGHRRRARAALSRCVVRWRDGRMGGAKPGGPRCGARPRRPACSGPARRLVMLEMALPPQPQLAPALPVLFPARAAVDRPADLETYDRLYLVTSVHARVSRAGRAGAAARGAGIP